MVIAALLCFGALLVAWIVAPSRPQRVEAPLRVEASSEGLARAA
ncbi:MAG TPA: hypothetical protein VF013_10030 [Candidatus Limnocylindria bacterium]